MPGSKEANDIQVDLNKLISTQEAADISGLTQEHIALLLRTNQLWGRKIGRNWVTSEQTVREYMARDRRPGPKKRG